MRGWLRKPGHYPSGHYLEEKRIDIVKARKLEPGIYDDKGERIRSAAFLQRLRHQSTKYLEGKVEPGIYGDGENRITNRATLMRIYRQAVRYRKLKGNP